MATLDIGWACIGDQFGKHGVDAAFAEVLRRCRQLDGVRTAEPHGLFQVNLELAEPRTVQSVVSALQRELQDDPVRATIGERQFQIDVTVSVVDEGS